GERKGEKRRKKRKGKRKEKKEEGEKKKKRGKRREGKEEPRSTSASAPSTSKRHAVPALPCCAPMMCEIQSQKKNSRDFYAQKGRGKGEEGREKKGREGGEEKERGGREKGEEEEGRETQALVDTMIHTNERKEENNRSHSSR
ncbi:hypothetical protein, partial [Pseudomonas aeruginosa]|uniref:hypothetical protein n=1 Tax=Pseudomonas aeruginosa TaxID=287 RepID=UPI002341BAE5